MTGFAPIAATSLGQSSTNANYQLQVSSGTFTLSLRGAALLIADVFPHGLFDLDGQAVTLSAQRPLPVTTGTFDLTGQNVELDYGFGIVVDTTTFTYSGQTVVLDVGFGLSASNGSFALNGQSFDFTKQMNMSAETGVFTYTGQDAFKGVSEAFAVGAFTYTGHAVDMTVQRHFDVGAGSYSYSFHDFKIRGWLTPIVSVNAWANVTSIPPATWTDAA